MSPSSIPAGAGDTQITIVGSGFINSTSVAVAGSNISITSETSSQIVATVPTADFSVAKSLSIAVTNPSPGGGSATSSVTIVPQLVSVQPGSVVVGQTISLSVLGADTQNLANNAVMLTQTGRSFTTAPTTVTSQGGATVLNVGLPSGMSPVNSGSSLSLPTSISLKVNGVAAQGNPAVQVHAPPHAIAISPGSAEQNTSVALSLVGAFTAFDSGSTIVVDDPGLVVSNLAAQSSDLITASLSIRAGTASGDHVLSVSSAGSSVSFHFAVLPSSSNAPVLTGLSSAQLAPGAALTLTGSGFLPSNGSGQGQILYSFAGVSAGGSVRPTSDNQIVVPIPLLIDPSSGSIYTGAVTIQVFINGKPSNNESLTVTALPSNTGSIGDTTKDLLAQLQSKVNTITTQITPMFAADGGAAYNSFASGALTGLQQLQADVAMAASGGKVTTPDGTVIDQATIDLIDRLLQSSGAPLAIKSASAGQCHHDRFQLSSPKSESPIAETTTISLGEPALLVAGSVCNGGDVLANISEQLTNATIITCAASLIPPLAPVAGPVCGFLRLLSTVQILVELTNLACDVAPVNLASISPDPPSISTIINGPQVTESPTAIFKSTGDSLSQDAETTTDLILTALHFDEGPWRYITGNKVVADVLNDAFQLAFTQLVGNALDTKNTQIFYFQTNPVRLTQVALEPSPSSFFTFSGLTIQPGDNAGSTDLYFDTSNFRTLDPSGNVTNVSSIVTGNQIPAVIHTIVTVSPATTTVAPGGQVSFHADTNGVGTVWGVTWSVDSIQGGSATVGVILSSGLYTAPLTTGTHTITATSLFDGTSGSATVTLVGTGSSISISPRTVTVPAGSVQTFSANVQGGGSAVWSVQEGTAGGTISGTGIYTAPIQAGTYHVIAANSTNSSQTSVAAVTVVPVPSITTIHSFNHAIEGAIPWGNPVFGTDGYLYGTTEAGGNLSCRYISSLAGCGTIYRSDTSGNLTTLHNFTGSDGAYPSSSLLATANGTLYGTTGFGGTNTSDCVVSGTSTFSGCGSIFSLDAYQNFSSLYSFGPYNSALAISPQAALIQGSDGNIYGANEVGGPVACNGKVGGESQAGCGAIFKRDSSNAFTVLHTFSVSDGGYPAAALLQLSNGDFFGTTFGGGSLTCSSYATPGCGIVLQMNLSGSVKVLHSFTQQDGAAPDAPLVLGSDGQMYGTTLFGGTAACAAGATWQGCGTAFKIDTAGNFQLLHNFSGPDGAYPGQLMQASDGYFYGTTESGGDPNCAGRYGPGCGVVFRMDSAGNVTVLYSFTGQSDGSWPESAVVQASDGSLYGTTAYGGANDEGVLFKISNLAALAAASPTSGVSLVIRNVTSPRLVTRPHVGRLVPVVSPQR